MSQEQAISYGDVFPGVQGELAKAAVAPGDAALMQSAESIATGQTLKGGPAATMQSAAARNELSGHVGHGQVGRVIAEKGVGVVEKGVPGHRTFTETIGHQPVGGCVTRGGSQAAKGAQGSHGAHGSHASKGSQGSHGAKGSHGGKK